MRIVIEAQFFPTISYFWLLNQAEHVTIDQFEHYIKQTFRNRMVINGANGPLTLTIPIQHRSSKMKMREVLVEHREQWMKQHWRSIQSAYGKAPFFDHFAPYVAPLFNKEKSFLMDYLLDSLSICQKLLQAEFKVELSEKYIEQEEGLDFDLRSAISPKERFGSLSGFSPKPYFQLFGKDFAPDLSILDLLFCEGPNALSIIEGSGQIKKEQLQKTQRFLL